MKKYLLLLFVAIFITPAVFSQAEFMNGYIVKNDGSYVYGQLEYISKGYVKKECLFRWFDISNETIFLPEDISAFGFTYGLCFKSVRWEGQEIFMTCLVDGDLDLLYDGSKLYLNGMGLSMVPLDNGSGSVNAQGKMVSYSGYKDLLNKLPDPENKFTIPEDVTPRPDIMTEIIAGYNRSRGAKTMIFAMKNPTGLYDEMRNLGSFISSYGIIGGMNASRYDADKFNYQRLGFVPEMDFFEMAPFFGVFYSRPLTRKSDLFSLQIELMAFRTNVYMYDEFTDYTGITRSDINIRYTGIKIPVSIRISPLKGSYKPYLSAGLFIMTNYGGTYTREGEVENALHVVRPFSDNSITVKPQMSGFLGGLGLKKELSPKQSVFLELRGEYGSGIYEREGLKQKTLIFDVIAGIDFL
jgi:hypothetical protein